MQLLWLCLGALLGLSIGYFTYGKYLRRLLNLQSSALVPAHQLRDNEDFVPAKKFYLVNQHLSAIAAAGPIVGPILAGMWFGWLPTILWIILGGIFIGGAHDMVSLVASVRHQGRSIADIIKECMGRRAFILFLLFLWFSLIYIIAAFTDVTASTFAEPKRGASIASSSMLYLGLAMMMGLLLKRFPNSLPTLTTIFLPLVFGCILLGPMLPLKLPLLFHFDLKMSWNIFLVLYCFIAAIAPVWLLLQPRGYLGGFFLLLTVGISFLGLILGSLQHDFPLRYPAFVSWTNPQGLPLLPLLFTTVACGACSGFHCLIASGTTSKQLDKETDAQFVGYGGMLLECFVAVMALGTVAILTIPEAQSLKSPDQIYAHGIAIFLSKLGIPKEFALNFALLAFATFVYDTLDVATRLGRYIFQELTGWKDQTSAYLTTFITLLLPLLFLTQTFSDAHGNPIPGWKVFWTLFGSSNQLLAAMVLFGLSIWLFKQKINLKVTLLPSLFMLLIAVSSLIIIIKPWLLATLSGNFKAEGVGLTCLALLILTTLLVVQGTKILLLRKSPN